MCRKHVSCKSAGKFPTKHFFSTNLNCTVFIVNMVRKFFFKVQELLRTSLIFLSSAGNIIPALQPLNAGALSDFISLVYAKMWRCPDPISWQGRRVHEKFGLGTRLMLVMWLVEISVFPRSFGMLGASWSLSTTRLQVCNSHTPHSLITHTLTLLTHPPTHTHARAPSHTHPHAPHPHTLTLTHLHTHTCTTHTHPHTPHPHTLILTHLHTSHPHSSHTTHTLTHPHTPHTPHTHPHRPSPATKPC